MYVEYRTYELGIAGHGKKYAVFEVYENATSRVLKGKVFEGTLPQCKAFVDGYLYAHGGAPNTAQGK